MSSTLLSSVTDMQSATAMQQAQDYLKEVEESAKNGGRTAGGDMGKHDFLMLLSAQLRYQDPLEPQSDADFAAQLAQFTSLEQMQNMNATLEAMNGLQSYNLIGRYVLAEAMIDGKFQEIPGVVDSIFTKDGVTHAQIGEYVVPVASIIEVFDTNNILTTEMFMQTSSHLIGRTVIADLTKETEGEGAGSEIEGIVTRVLVDKGKLVAQIDDGTGEYKFVLVNTIVDIRETGTDRFDPKPDYPPEAINFKEDPDNGGFIEYAEDMATVVGRWDWSDIQWKWLYTDNTGQGLTKPEKI